MAAVLGGPARGFLAPAPPAAPRATSLADFTIVQPLGKGSYGSVHKAVRRSDGLRSVPAASGRPTVALPLAHPAATRARARLRAPRLQLRD
jgi:serine/threonine protein kinase